MNADMRSAVLSYAAAAQAQAASASPPLHNSVPAPGPSTQVMHSKPEPAVVVSSSRRPIQSCAECKRRKIKCNRVIPCEPCTARGEQNLCREVEKVDPAVTYALITDVDALQNRVVMLENELANLKDAVRGLHHSGNAATGPDSVSSPRHSAMVRHAQSNSAAASNADPLDIADARQPHPDEEVALVLEDLAMGHRVNKDRATQRLTSSTSIPKVGSSTQLNLPSPQIPPSASLHTIKDSNPLAFFIPSEFDWVHRVLSVLPSPQQSAALVHFYFHKVEWYTKALHKPTYLQDCQKLFSLPIHEAARQMRPSFLAVHAMVLCLALHLIEGDVQAQINVTQEEAAQLTKKMFSAAQAVLWASDWMSNHSLESLQCIVLMGVYQFNVDEQSDSAWALLGSAIKVAQNIGLARLGAETEARKQLWPEAWKSFAKREVGRRVWWNLVMLDWSHAIAHGATYTAHPGQSHTAQPSNVNDDDMPIDSPDFMSYPLDRYTESSFIIFKIRFTILYRELIDHLITHAPAQYSFVLNMDKRLVKLMDSLPDHFRDPHALPEDSDPNLVKECILLGLMGETRLLRLHRPYLTRGFKDAKFAPSKDRCVHSARNILTLLGVAGRRCPELLRFWIVIFYCFAAAIVTFVDLTREPTEATRNLLTETLILLKTAENVSAAARNAIRLLEGLLGAETEIRSTQQTNGDHVTKKRKLDSASDTVAGGDPFQKAVNKLLLAAADSPSTAGAVAADSTAHLSTSPSSSHVGSLPTNWEGISPSALNSAFDLLVPPPSAQFSDLDIFFHGNGITPTTSTLPTSFSSLLASTPSANMAAMPSMSRMTPSMTPAATGADATGMSSSELSAAAFAADLSHLFGHDFVFADPTTSFS
ncbi:hypothetical protein ACM66B_002256 [Microbotryomycetes sp. NB124-2]